DPRGRSKDHCVLQRRARRGQGPGRGQGFAKIPHRTGGGSGDQETRPGTGGASTFRQLARYFAANDDAGGSGIAATGGHGGLVGSAGTGAGAARPPIPLRKSRKVGLTRSAS